MAADATDVKATVGIGRCAGDRRIAWRIAVEVQIDVGPAMLLRAVIGHARGGPRPTQSDRSRDWWRHS